MTEVRCSSGGHRLLLWGLGLSGLLVAAFLFRSNLSAAGDQDNLETRLRQAQQEADFLRRELENQRQEERRRNERNNQLHQRDKEMREIREVLKGQVDLWLEPSKPGLGEPVVTDAQFYRFQEIFGKQYLEFHRVVRRPDNKEQVERWLIEPARIITVRVKN
jgi:hypothetical protein